VQISYVTLVDDRKSARLGAPAFAEKLPALNVAYMAESGPGPRTRDGLVSDIIAFRLPESVHHPQASEQEIRRQSL
jgi:hypothetical protein